MGALPLVRHDPAAPFAYCANGLVSAGEFLADAAELAARLPDRRYVVNLCADRYRFALGFAAALCRGQTSLMPPNQTLDFMGRLTRDYPDAYCLSDADCQLPSGRHTPSTKIPCIPPEHTAAIVFTSGSTGDPVPHAKSWGALAAGAAAGVERLGIRAWPGLALLGTLPPQHTVGLEATVLLALQGGLVLHAGRPFFPAEVCAELEALPRPRALVTSPVHLRALLAESGALPPLDFVLCATAPLPPQLAAQAEARFGAPLQEIYGCTEAGQLASRRPAETQEWRLFPGIALRQDERGTWVKGGHAQSELLLGDVVERVVDAGDAERFLLHGRSADVVNIAGKRTSLAALNHHLSSIRGVRDAAFVVPAEGDGAVTRLAAFVVAPGLTRAEILSALRQRIDPAFLPRPLHLVDALPRSASGKLPRAALESLAKAE
jgi:acyl-coenzyme A synthetase/AMP-(fatty) acid ligase